MKRSLFSAIMIIAVLFTYGQDASVKDLKAAAMNEIKTDSGKIGKKGWRKGGLISINLTQVGNSNWVAAGGDKFSLSAAASLNVFARKNWGRKSWDNVLDINYGIVNTTTLGVRKVNDRIDFVSKLGYQPKNWKHARLSLLGQFRSQLTNGYDYNYFDSAVKRRNSGFFAPAYITLAPGIEWIPNDWFSLFVSPASGRWTIVSNAPYSYVSQGGVFYGHQETPLATLYGVDPAKEHRFEFGAFLTASARKDILKNVKYVGKIDLYSNYLKNPQNIDLFWTNQFQLNINKWIKVSYSIDLLYDDDIKQKQTDPLVAPRSVGLQVLSTLGVGFAAKF